MSTATNAADLLPQEPQPASGLSLVPPPLPLVKQRMTLYELTIEGLEIERALIDSEGELTPELEARFDRMLESGPEAIDAAGGIIKELIASEEYSKKEKDRLAARQKAFENNWRRLKARVRIALDSAFSGKLKTRRFNMWTSKGHTKTAVEFVALESSLENLHNVTPEFVKEIVTTTYEIDEAAVLAVWTEEAPIRQAYFDAMSAWREACSHLAPEAPEPPMPQEPESKIPKVLQVNISEGDRSLTIK